MPWRTVSAGAGLTVRARSARAEAEQRSSHLGDQAGPVRRPPPVSVRDILVTGEQDISIEHIKSECYKYSFK